MEPLFTLRPWWIIAALAVPTIALAQTDEIQVYDANIAAKGKINLEVHNNFTPDGRKTPDFPGAVISNHAWVGVAEWAYGVTDWFEQGLYLPLYSHSTNLGGTYNGFKIRELFVRPHAEDHTFFYGVNFEFSVNQPQWDQRHYTSEIRPIIGLHLKEPGLHLKPIDIIVNPIVDTAYHGGVKSLQLVPAVRVAYNFSDKWAGSIEQYSDYGQLRDIQSAHNQFQQIWAVVNHKTKIIDIETGVGFGVTAGSDRVTMKLMLSRDIN